MSGYDFWALKSTYGLPLEFIMEELFSENIYPKWDEVLLAAKKDGANIEKLVRNLVQYFETMKNSEYMVLCINALHKKMVKDGKI